MRDPRDYKLDLASAPSPSPSSPAPNSRSPRPYLCVHFACCGVYQRIYRQPQDTAYRGRCPRCGRTVCFPVGHGGTNQRFFTAR